MIRAARTTPAGLASVASRGAYRFPAHLQLLNFKLWQLGQRHIKRLIVEMPPRHGKSETCSKYFPAWLIGALHQSVILTSYEATFAASWGRKVRDILTEWGPSLYGVRVSDGSAAMHWWELEGGLAAMMTAGVGGPITGKGGNVIIDDPLKNAEEASSPLIRERIWEWFQSTAYTRLGPDDFVLLVMTRWHDDDLAGRLLKAAETGEGDQWEVVRLPAIAEQDERIPLLEGYSYRRAEGQPLWPGRFSLARLNEIRTAVGSRVWESLYQQRPTPEAGLIWHREWFKRYSRLGGYPQFKRKIQTIDTAFKTGVANDYSVIATWGYTGNAIYLIDCWRARVEYPDLKRAIADQAAKHTPDAIYVEDTAAGQSIIQEMTRSTLLPIIPWPATSSKEARAAAVSPIAEAGNVYIPDGSHPDDGWVSDWLEEHVAFPRGAHDDYHDTTLIALENIRPDTFTQGPKVF